MPSMHVAQKFCFHQFDWLFVNLLPLCKTQSLVPILMFPYARNCRHITVPVNQELQIYSCSRTLRTANIPLFPYTRNCRYTLLSVHQELQRCPIHNHSKHLRWSFFTKVITSFQTLTICAKCFILHVWLGFEYAIEVIYIASFTRDKEIYRADKIQRSYIFHASFCTKTRYISARNNFVSK